MDNNKWNSDPCTMSFGRYLKALRIQKGISIESVSDEIRISLQQLSLIEAEDHNQLPDEVYVKGILRAYAKLIGIDDNDIVDRYIINRSVFQETQKAETDLLNSGKKVLSRLLLSMSLLIIIVVLSIYLIYGFQTNQTDKVKNKRSEMATHSVTERAIDSAVSPLSATNETDKLFLQIDAFEDTWIKVMIDDHEPIEYFMNPRDHIELEAETKFNMLVGNAGGVKMRLNDKPVTILGKSGDVVNIELTRETELSE